MERSDTTSVLEPDPVIEAYKKDVDRTLLRENLRLSPEQRIEKLISLARFGDDIRAAMQRQRAKATE